MSDFLHLNQKFAFFSSTKTDTISMEKLIDFMNEKQRDPRLNEISFPLYGDKRVMEIINKYEKSEENRKNSNDFLLKMIFCIMDLTILNISECLSKEGLTEYMLSDENAPVFLDRLDIYQDMDQPMCHYYVNSSHNTYLTGKCLHL